MSRRISNWSTALEPSLADGTRRGDEWTASYEDDDGTVYRIRGEGVYEYPKVTVTRDDGASYTFDMTQAVKERKAIAADADRFRAFIVAVNGWGGELEWRTKADMNEAKPLPAISRSR